MTQRDKEKLTADKLAQMSGRELTDEFLKERKRLEAKDPNTLTDNEKSYLLLAIFYTTKQ